MLDEESMHTKMLVYRLFVPLGWLSPIIRVGEVPGSNPGAPISEGPANAGLSRIQASLAGCAWEPESGAYCPFTAQTWPSTSDFAVPAPRLCGASCGRRPAA